MNNPKVIIIGAGASGIAAAVKLLENKFGDVTILEAEKRIGGRINSVEFGGSVVDLGAHLCHGEDTIVYELSQGLDLLAPAFNDYTEHTFYESSGVATNKQIADRLFQIITEITKEKKGMKESEDAFDDYIAKRFRQRVDNEFAGNKKASAVANGVYQWFCKFSKCGQDQASAKGQSHIKSGGKDYHWKNRGYRTILHVLMKQIPDITEQISIDSKIYYGKEVTKIVWDDNKINNGGVSIECSDGSSYNADHAIVTLPLGVLKAKYTTLFQPELPPDNVTAIQHLGYKPLDKILLKFPQKWWANDCKGFSFVWREEDCVETRTKYPQYLTEEGKSWLEYVFGFYVLESHPRILVGWVVGVGAIFMEQLAKEVVQEGCMYLLQKFVGRKYNVQQPEDILRSSWSANTHFYGAGSYRSVDTEKHNTSAEVLAQPLVSGSKQVVLFSGEATHPNCYGTVHGAIESGFREAERIINIYSS